MESDEFELRQNYLTFNFTKFLYELQAITFVF